MKKAKEKEIKRLELEIQKSKQAEVEKKMSKKYHMVKFFERKKLLRRMNALKKDAGSNEEEIKATAADLEYIDFFPPDKKYVSILRNRDSDVVSLEPFGL